MRMFKMPTPPSAGRLIAFAAMTLMPSLAMAQDVTAGDLVIQHPWARATPGGASVAGGYMTVTNHGAAPDRLMGGSSEVSKGFDLHTMSMDNGIMTMRPTGPLLIPPGRSVTLAPNGTHVMLTGLRHGLKKGESVAGTLTFERAGAVPVMFEVEGIGAEGPAGAPGSSVLGHGDAMAGMKAR